MHFKNNNCEPKEIISIIQQILNDVKKAHKFHPKSFKIVQKTVHDSSISGNGWWGDIRDHDLCLSFTQPPERVTGSD